MGKDIKIIVATHKEYAMPNDKMYLPLFVGSNITKPSFDINMDNVGDNISEKNKRYCELTGIYWMWKNLDSDYYGIVHYRRYLFGKLEFNANNKKHYILSSEEANNILNSYDVILPTKRNYYIQSIYNHYKSTMYVEPLDEVGRILSENNKEYLPEFEKLKSRKSAHLFNMFIMKKDIFNNYCNWLFPILDELDRRIDSTKYNEFHARFIGRISEMLLDVYINTNNIKYKEVKFVDIEGSNFVKKVFSVIKSKITGKKYEKSF